MQVVSLAKFYNLNLEVQHHKIILKKTKDTKPGNKEEIREYINNQLNSTKPKNRKRRRNLPKLKPGDIVADGIPPLASDNKGHQILTKMGWKGGSIGEKGIKEPINAIVYKKNQGIGY